MLGRASYAWQLVEYASHVRPFPQGEKFQVDPSDDANPGVADHALPDDAKGPHPLADPANDPTPGVPGHAKDD